MGESGSPLYALTWKRLAMPSAPHVCQLAASVRLTGDTAFSGWPTAATRDGKGGYQGGRIRFGKLSIDTLDTAAQLASWATPIASGGGHPTDPEKRANYVSPKGYRRGHQGNELDHQAHLAAWPTPLAGNADGSQAPKDASPTGKRTDGSKATVSLPTIARLADWPTPRASENVQTKLDQIAEKGSSWLGQGRGATVSTIARLASWPTARASDGEKNVRTLEGSLAEFARKGSPQDLAQAAALGAIPTGSTVGTANGGQLNPALSLWLMGFPAEWESCAPQATPSSRKSQRSS